MDNTDTLNETNNQNSIDIDLDKCKLRDYEDSIKDYVVNAKESISQVGFTSKKHTYAKKQRRNTYAKNFYKK